MWGVRIRTRRFSVSPHNVERENSVYGPYIFPPTRHVRGQGVFNIWPFFTIFSVILPKIPPYPSPYVRLKQEPEITCQGTDLLHPVVIPAAVTMGRGYILTVKREFYDRLHPLSFYTETKFVQRYRLSKAVVRILIKQYVATKKKKILRGKHAIPHSLMVSIYYPPTALSCTVCSISIHCMYPHYTSYCI